MSVRFVSVIVALSGGFLVLVGVTAGSRGSPGDIPPSAAKSAHAHGPMSFAGRESFHFVDLKMMAATADAIVAGTVTKRTDAERVTVDGVDGPVRTSLQFVDLTIEVDDVLKGSTSQLVVVRAVTLQDQPEHVSTPDYPFGPDSASLVPGSHLMVFMRTEDSGRRLLNSQGGHHLRPRGGGGLR